MILGRAAYALIARTRSRINYPTLAKLTIFNRHNFAKKWKKKI